MPGQSLPRQAPGAGAVPVVTAIADRLHADAQLAASGDLQAEHQDRHVEPVSSPSAQDEAARRSPSGFLNGRQEGQGLRCSRGHSRNELRGVPALQGSQMISQRCPRLVAEVPGVDPQGQRSCGRPVKSPATGRSTARIDLGSVLDELFGELSRLRWSKKRNVEHRLASSLRG